MSSPPPVPPLATPALRFVGGFLCAALSPQAAASAVLTKLRESQFGWVFNDPVDPVHLNLPDYFEVRYSTAFAELVLACPGFAHSWVTRS